MILNVSKYIIICSNSVFAPPSLGTMVGYQKKSKTSKNAGNQ